MPFEPTGIDMTKTISRKEDQFDGLKTKFTFYFNTFILKLVNFLSSKNS